MSRRIPRSLATGPLLLCLIACELLVGTAPVASQVSGTSDHEISLAELLVFAERHAPAIQVASRKRAYSAAERTGAEPWLRNNPTLDLAMGPRFGGSNPVALDFVASIAQPVEVAGERGLRLEATSRFGERLDAELVLARWEVRCQVIAAYRSAIVEREQVGVAGTLARFAGEMLTTAQRRLAAGDATVIDVRVAEIDLAQARQFSISAEQMLRAARIRLAEASGWPIDTPPQATGALAPVGPMPELAALLDTAAAHHPELQARRDATLEAAARTHLANRQQWPTPVVGIQVAREGSAGSPANYIVLGTVGLPLPVWQTQQAERAHVRVDENVARDDETLSRRAIHRRVAIAHSQLKSAADRLALFASSVSPSLEESLALLRRGFDAGELPLVTVALARERFLQSQLDVLGAYGDYYRAHADLESAVGVVVNITPGVASAGGAP